MVRECAGRWKAFIFSSCNIGENLVLCKKGEESSYVAVPHLENLSSWERFRATRHALGLLSPVVVHGFEFYTRARCAPIQT